MSVRVFVLFSRTCQSCEHINQSEHDPRGELVTCVKCSARDDAEDAYPDIDLADFAPPIPVEKNTPCPRTGPHEPHPWMEAVADSARHRCTGIPTPGGPA